MVWMVWMALMVGMVGMVGMVQMVEMVNGADWCPVKADTLSEPPAGNKPCSREFLQNF